MSITPTSLRKNLYNILDEIIKTGKPVEIIRKGVKLTINPEKKKNIFDILEKHSVMTCNPEDIVNSDFSENWNSNF